MLTLGVQIRVVVQVKCGLQSETFAGTTHNLLIIAVALFVVQDKGSIDTDYCHADVPNICSTIGTAAAEPVPSNLVGLYAYGGQLSRNACLASYAALGGYQQL